MTIERAVGILERDDFFSIEEWCEAFDMAVNALKRVEWNYCNEKIPEEPRFGDDCYLVMCADQKNPITAFWDGGEWYDNQFYPVKNVYAWMPLPLK